MSLRLDYTDIIAKKWLGQNFLKDTRVAKRIAEYAGGNVIEIGTGLGHLTTWLAKKADTVVGFEIDKTLFKFTEKNLKLANGTIINDDARNFAKYVEEPVKYTVFSNLPYSEYVSILLTFFESDIFKYYLMIQEKVYRKITAKPGDRKYSAIGVIISHWFKIKKLLNVNRNSFSPRPYIDSVFIELCRKTDEKFTISYYQKLKAVLARRNNVLKPYNMRPLHMTPDQLVNIVRGQANDLSL